MKGFKYLAVIVAFSMVYSESRAQNAQVLGGNLLNGALTGSILGAATMGLENSGNFTPLRIGVGLGILGGAGVAVYDLATMPRQQTLYVSGIFNNGSNSSIILLLDTFYGAAAGGALGMAWMLVSDQPIVDGLQYGASAGAWAGFGFGLIDAFVLADHNRNFAGSHVSLEESLITVSSDRYHLGLLHASELVTPRVGTNDITISSKPAVGVVSFRMDL